MKADIKVDLQLRRLIERFPDLRLIPLKPGHKHPFQRDWPNKSLPAKEALRRYPGYNFGVVTGASDLFVIDVDVKNDKNGFTSLKRILTQEEFNKLKDSFTVRTPSGGHHIYYKGRLDGIRDPTLTGVDIRAATGQVVAPGSVIDGKKYEVVKDHPIENATRLPFLRKIFQERGILNRRPIPGSKEGFLRRIKALRVPLEEKEYLEFYRILNGYIDKNAGLLSDRRLKPIQKVRRMAHSGACNFCINHQKTFFVKELLKSMKMHYGCKCTYEVVGQRYKHQNTLRSNQLAFWLGSSLNMEKKELLDRLFIDLHKK